METWVRKIGELHSNYRCTIPFGSVLKLSLFTKEISAFHLEVTLVIAKKEMGQGSNTYVKIPSVKKNN